MSDEKLELQGKLINDKVFRAFLVASGFVKYGCPIVKLAIPRLSKLKNIIKEEKQ